MGSKLGAAKVAAKRIGVSLDEWLARRIAGQRRCTSCKQWKAKERFPRDRSRRDGVATKCRQCREAPGRRGPSRRTRLQKRLSGLAWCRGCENWFAQEQILKGACRFCRNAEERGRYRSNVAFREYRKLRRDFRKRGIERVPPEAAEDLLEAFDHSCAYCGGPPETWDHIEPVVSGDITRPGNVVPACGSCNSSKGSKDVLEWIDARGLEPHPALYHEMERGAALS